VAASPTPPNSPNSSPELTEVERLRKLMKRATPLPWAWEQCGEKEDAPVVGVIVDGNNQPLTGCVECYNEDGSERGYYRETIAYDWQHCDGHSASANADFVVGAVNALPKLLDLIEALSSKNELPSEIEGLIERLLRKRVVPWAVLQGQLANPDGREAAQAILSLQRRLADAEKQIRSHEIGIAASLGAALNPKDTGR
jgi:hypothetical protein